MRGESNNVDASNKSRNTERRMATPPSQKIQPMMPAFLHFRQCSDCETSHSGAKVLLKMGQPSCRCASLDRSLLPRPALSRGRDERSSLWEGWGEGQPPQTPNMDVCSPIAQISDFNFQTPLKTSIRDLAARCARGFASSFTLLESRGRRESRVRAAPAVSRAQCI